jgi:prepilin-type N-terminal cleavage/methylation domain-containing protein/prepilin-type processing-associated H-X9-DG protein
MTRRIKNAFTLVELLVVIGIIALLVAILLPSLNKARATARRIACQSGERQLFIFATMYANDNRDFYPPYNVQVGAIAAGYDPSAPWYSWWLLDPYSRVKFDSAGTIASPGHKDYDLYGPTSRNIYFCDDFRSLHVRSAGNPFGFGYAVNTNYTGAFRPWTTPMLSDGVRRTKIPASSRTIFMREINVPYTYDSNLAGPDVWPLNLTTRAPSFAAGNYATLHMGGQNILYFDGHSRYFKYPDAVDGQIVDGFTSDNYSNVFAGYWP